MPRMGVNRGTRSTVDRHNDGSQLDDLATFMPGTRTVARPQGSTDDDRSGHAEMVRPVLRSRVKQVHYGAGLRIDPAEIRTLRRLQLWQARARIVFFVPAAVLSSKDMLDVWRNTGRAVSGSHSTHTDFRTLADPVSRGAQYPGSGHRRSGAREDLTSFRLEDRDHIDGGNQCLESESSSA